MYKIGIVGRGFVGSAVEFGFSPQTGCDVDDLYIYDANDRKIKMIQLNRDEALEAFKIWQNKEDKIKY